jgi:ABC-type lipoprotein export system ATPase subunit
MFDAPHEKKCVLNWRLDVPIDANDWNVGLIVGPSGSGKSTVMRELFGAERKLKWVAASVIDDFGAELSAADVAASCSSVGFNTIPAWLRPYAVLSNGEKFRVELARRLMEDGNPIVMDEFTSVVDRQVAQIGSHAVQKYCRKRGKQFVAVTCHFDLIDWLQPDWVLDMATRQFTRRLLQQRPALECIIGRIPRSAWSLFAPYHYMSADLHRGAKCFGLWLNNRLSAFSGIIPCPISRGKAKGGNVWRISRLVTLPDYQGLGLAFVLTDAIGAAYKAKEERLRNYPAHPSLVRSHDRSSNWSLIRPPGRHSTSNSTSTSVRGKMGGRPCAIFEYCGPAATECQLL